MSIRKKNSPVQWNAIHAICNKYNLTETELEQILYKSGSILKGDTVENFAEYVKEDGFNSMYGFLNFELKQARK